MGLLAQLRGSHVSIDVDGEQKTGRLMGMQQLSAPGGAGYGSAYTKNYMSLLLDSGAMCNIDFARCAQITLMDQSLQNDVQQVLDTLLTANKQDMKSMVLGDNAVWLYCGCSVLYCVLYCVLYRTVAVLCRHLCSLRSRVNYVQYCI